MWLVRVTKFWCSGVGVVWWYCPTGVIEEAVDVISGTVNSGLVTCAATIRYFLVFVWSGGGLLRCIDAILGGGCQHFI